MGKVGSEGVFGTFLIVIWVLGLGLLVQLSVNHMLSYLLVVGNGKVVNRSICYFDARFV